MVGRGIALRVLVPAKRGHPSDRVVDDLIGALASSAPVARVGPHPGLGKVMMRLRTPLRRRRAVPVVVPMMGARFDLLYGATLHGLPVPVAWDVWEPTWSLWISRLGPLSLPLVAVTSKESAEYLQDLLPDSRVVCLPEATSLRRYQPGTDLKDRTVDILELGRRFGAWHESITAPAVGAGLVHLFEPQPGSLVFEDETAMISGLSSTKLSVCFPSSVTHPSRSGNVTTMTHRYLESIASRCLIIGEPVPELTELLGFDPVVAVDMESPWEQVSGILENIEAYQGLVDRAWGALQPVGGWGVRAQTLLQHIEDAFQGIP